MESASRTDSRTVSEFHVAYNTMDNPKRPSSNNPSLINGELICLCRISSISPSPNCLFPKLSGKSYGKISKEYGYPY